MNDEAAAIASDIALLARSPLLDWAWYEALYPESCANGGNPLVYFCNTGWRLRHLPNPYFDTAFYLARNTDVREAGVNPLAHYLAYGESESRWPSLHFDPDWYRQSRNLSEGERALCDLLQRCREGDEPAPNAAFDPVWYRTTYSALILPGLSAFADFCLFGVTEKRDSSLAHRIIRNAALFDEDFYRTHPSVAESDLDPAYHFCAIGWRQNLRPCLDFDIDWYCASYPDVRDNKVNPLFHFLQFGESEGRLPQAPLVDREIALMVEPLGQSEPAFRQAEDAAIIYHSGLFDANFYFANYPDVRHVDRDPLEHFCQFGWREGRRPNSYFDPTWYDDTYLGGDKSCNPLTHYIQEGESRSFRPIVYFETDWYRRIYCLADTNSPLGHYLRNRRSQAFSPTSHFDVRFYLTRHGGTIGRNRDPFAHFLRTAITENVNPNACFDSQAYRARYMTDPTATDSTVSGAESFRSVRREQLNPLVHYLLHADLVAQSPTPVSI